MVYNMDNTFFAKYLTVDFCTIDTPFEEIGFLNCHRRFKDIDMFDITHIEKGSLIEREIEQTGVEIYEE